MKSLVQKAVLTLIAALLVAAPSGGTEPIGRLFQIILNVEDMAGQIDFWRGTMDLDLVYPQDSKDLAAEPFVRLDAGGTYLVLHAGRQTTNSRDEPRLSFMTEDLEGARQRVLDADLPASEVRSPAPGVLVVDCRDPEGNAFHLESHERAGGAAH